MCAVSKNSLQKTLICFQCLTKSFVSYYHWRIVACGSQAFIARTGNNLKRCRKQNNLQRWI